MNLFAVIKSRPQGVAENLDQELTDHAFIGLSPSVADVSAHRLIVDHQRVERNRPRPAQTQFGFQHVIGVSDLALAQQVLRATPARSPSSVPFARSAPPWRGLAQVEWSALDRHCLEIDRLEVAQQRPKAAALHLRPHRGERFGLALVAVSELVRRGGAIVLRRGDQPFRVAEDDEPAVIGGA